MDPQQSEDLDPWPAGPMVPRPLLMEQCWEDAVILHWRISEAVAAPYMPPGVRPDVFHGSTWVGLFGFRMSAVRLGATVPLPGSGAFAEINVRLYSRGEDGTRGVVFLSMDAARLAVVLAARAFRLPY